MPVDDASVARQAVVLDAEGLDALVRCLREDGRLPVAAGIRDGAVVIEALGPRDTLPSGWVEEKDAGRATVRRREDARRFAHLLGASGWKRLFFPAARVLFEARKEGDSGAFVVEAPEPAAAPLALVGVRPCDLAALATLDRVFAEGPYPDSVWSRGRRSAFVVAAACTESAATCFCASLGSGPGLPGSGFDVGLVEIGEPNEPAWLVRAASEPGEAMLARLRSRPAAAADLEAAERAVAHASRTQTRSLAPGAAAALRERTDPATYEAVAERCFACGNCTLVCPTCFCTTCIDRIAIDGRSAARERVSDTCFSRDFTALHGGAVRTSRGARYRQWIRHKLVHLEDQFGAPGCVGCGRCIAWCPAAIDLTAEA